MKDLPTIATKLHDFYDDAYGEMVKVSGEYMVTLRVAKMWKYRKRWKFRYPYNQSKKNNFISVTWQDQQIGKNQESKVEHIHFLKGGNHQRNVTPSHCFSLPSGCDFAKKKRNKFFDRLQLELQGPCLSSGSSGSSGDYLDPCGG